VLNRQAVPSADLEMPDEIAVGEKLFSTYVCRPTEPDSSLSDRRIGLLIGFETEDF
jgi:hypothetical protein